MKILALSLALLTLTACNSSAPTTPAETPETADIEIVEVITEPATVPDPVIEPEEEPPLEPEVIEAYQAEQAEAEIAQAEIKATVEAEAETVTQIGSGSFVGLDAGHDASGQVKILEMGDDIILEFQGDFATTPGPDLYVYISQPQSFGPQSKKGADVSKMKLTSALTATGGSQMYKVKKSDWNAYGSSVVIWCRAYGYLFGYANVQ